MPMIIWNNDYNVGIEEIDEQHKSLVQLINRLYAALAENSTKEAVGDILRSLVDYTRVHFAVEECLMRIFDYPEYNGHKASHDTLVRKVTELERQFLAGDDRVGMELLILLRGWLIGHIQEADARYVPHLTGQGVKKSWLRRFW